MSPLISAAELAAQYGHVDVLLDVRFGPDARSRYYTEHLVGAVYVDVETMLTGNATSPEVGGRHPLPPLKAWGKTLGALGITPTSRVVVYDDAFCAKAAARAWWMLRAVGHPHVQVLDGGIQSAKEAGVPTTGPASEEASAAQSTQAYPVSEWQMPTIEVSELDRVSLHPDWFVIDVRAAERHAGLVEPYEPTPGHIPGAINIPLASNLDHKGLFKPPEQLKELYTERSRSGAPEQVVVSCGSGITACHTILAFAHAGLPTPALYVGSYSEWCRSGRPIATGT